MTEPRRRPVRVAVSSPRTQAARRRSATVRLDLAVQTPVTEVYMRSLIRAQLRLAALVCAGLVAVLGGLPLLFALVPELSDVRVFGIRLPWFLLGGLIYPGFVVAGWLYIRAAERNERDFAELVDRR